MHSPALVTSTCNKRPAMLSAPCSCALSESQKMPGSIAQSLTCQSSTILAMLAGAGVTK
jgi:hypothetical protein